MAVLADEARQPVVQLLLGWGELLLGVVMPWMNKWALVSRLRHRTSVVDTDVPPAKRFVQCRCRWPSLKGLLLWVASVAWKLERPDLEI